MGSLGLGFKRSKGAQGRDPKDLFDFFAGRLGSAHENLLTDTESILAQRQANPFLGGFTGGLRNTQQFARGLRGSFDKLPGLLQQTALAQSDIGNRAASIAARQAAGGRGGLAFSGGAANIAGRIATGAAAQQNAALLGAQVTGEQARGQFNLGLLGLERGIGESLAAGSQAQGALFENRMLSAEERRFGSRNRAFDALAQLAVSGIGGSGGSIQNRARSQGFDFAASFGGGGGSSGGGGK
jgi:uncharacterized membrane protein YgcG